MTLVLLNIAGLLQTQNRSNMIEPSNRKNVFILV